MQGYSVRKNTYVGAYRDNIDCAQIECGRIGGCGEPLLREDGHKLTRRSNVVQAIQGPTSVGRLLVDEIILMILILRRLKVLRTVGYFIYCECLTLIFAVKTHIFSID